MCRGMRRTRLNGAHVLLARDDCACRTCVHRVACTSAPARPLRRHLAAGSTRRPRYYCGGRIHPPTVRFLTIQLCAAIIRRLFWCSKLQGREPGRWRWCSNRAGGCMFLTGKGSEAGGCRREKPRADGFFSSRRAKSLGRPKPGGGSREFPKTRAQTDFGKCPMSRPGARTPKVKEQAPG